MLIGILQAGHFPDELQTHFGDYDKIIPRFLEGHGFQFRTWAVVDMDFPNAVTAADGWLITGSKHGAYEDHPFIPPLEQFIQNAFMAKTPLVGICFGHQIIAKAMGGVVEKSQKGWGVGRQSYAYGDSEVAMNAWHQDHVIVKPPLATTIASNGFCEHAGFVYGKGAFSVQAHPEFEAPIVQGLINVRGSGMVPDNRLAYAQSQLKEPLDNQQVANDIAAFFKIPREAQE